MFTILLDKTWCDTVYLNRAITRSGIGSSNSALVEVRITTKTGLLIDTACLLLSYLNQLAGMGYSVSIVFEAGFDGAMGYLDRMGFLDLLDDRIATVPDRPQLSGRTIYHGTRRDMVEIEKIDLAQPINLIAQRLRDAVSTACGNRNDSQALATTAFTLFSECINNVYDHSGAELCGYAAAQIYKSGGTLVATISDSGEGILTTLRPSVANTKYELLSDSQLLVAAFNDGISRLGPERGLGLFRCSKAALKYKFVLNIRLPQCNVQLKPAVGQQSVNLAACDDNVAHIKGTHLSFKISIDNP